MMPVFNTVCVLSLLFPMSILASSWSSFGISILGIISWTFPLTFVFNSSPLSFFHEIITFFLSLSILIDSRLISSGRIMLSPSTLSKSWITSLPSDSSKSSAPSPPIRTSLPLPPLIVSSLIPPSNISSDFPPFKILGWSSPLSDLFCFALLILLKL